MDQQYRVVEDMHPPKVSLCNFLYYFFVINLIILQKINFFLGN